MASPSPKSSPVLPSQPDVAVAPSPGSEMDSQNLKMLLLLLPKLPLIVRVAVMHVLRLSEPAQYLDLRSALVISILRSFLEPSPSKPRSVSQIQSLTLKDAGIKGRIWVSTYASPVPSETGVRDGLMRALKDMRDTSLLEPSIRVPELVQVEAEWTGYRAAAAEGDPLPALSNRDLYHAMMKECSAPTTILYLHGGAYYLCDPSTHRPTTKKLAKLTGGRCYSVRYRLAPQDPFPAALLDAFVSYLTLLYPPPGAFHEAVRPEHVVFAGDSAGGNLALALTQLILELGRKDTPIFWYGELRHVPLPAAVATNSPWLDITQSSPSWQGDSPNVFDYLPKPEIVSRTKPLDCTIWPASPPRKHMYVDDELITHPLSSVIMARSWKGAPPMYICTGWEILAPEDKFLAKTLESQGVRVVFEEYEAMPHCFAMILTKIPNANRCYEGWAGFIRQAVEDVEGIESRAMSIGARNHKEVTLQFEELSEVGEEEIRARVLAKAALGPTEATSKL